MKRNLFIALLVLTSIICFGQFRQNQICLNYEDILHDHHFEKQFKINKNSNSIIFNLEHNKKINLALRPHENINKNTILIGGITLLIVPTISYYTDYKKTQSDKIAYFSFIAVGSIITFIGIVTH